MISGVMPFQGFFDRGKGKFPRRSLRRQRTTSTEMIITTDAAVQLEKPAMVDDSQQVSEAPVTGEAPPSYQTWAHPFCHSSGHVCVALEDLS